MKKILSAILAAVMLVGMLAVYAVAEGTVNHMLKFNDIPKGADAGKGIKNLADISKLALNDGDVLSFSMDFIYGRSGPCFHPAEKDLKHTSKFLVALGKTEGTNKFVGYSADRGTFFLATSPNDCYSSQGEGADGMSYLAESEKGLVKPGVTYNLEFVFTRNDMGDITGCVINVDGVTVLDFDLYDDLDYTTYLELNSLFIYPTHITCFLDNVVIVKDGETILTTDFEDASIKDVYEEDENGQPVLGEDGQPKPTGEKALSVAGWGFGSDVYSVEDCSNDVYAQPQYDVAEGQMNIVFKSGLNKRQNGIDDMFASEMDFKIPVTVENNKGFDKIELDLVADPFITVKGVEAADGLEATLSATDEAGVTKLTITGSGYTGSDLVTVVYSMAKDATQDHNYRYGALSDTVTVTGTDAEIIVTNGESKLYNYTIGDIDDDGKFNVNDVVYVLKFIAKWDKNGKLPGMFKMACDVNGDGRVNNMDVSYYLRWIAKWPNDYTINGITYYKK